MTVQCCCCHKVRSPKGWQRPTHDDLTGGDVSHGYCPACLFEALAKIDLWKKRDTRARRPA